MSRPIRNKDPELFRLITIRTEESRLWMVPSRKIEKLIGGIIARYQEILGIEVYAYCFLSNHYHLVIRAPRENTDEFAENVNREIARRLNWKFHRQGKFWSRRYDDQAILSHEDLLEAFLYVSTNPVRHGLVHDPRIWTGLSSYFHSLTEKDRFFIFHNYSAPEGQPKSTQHRIVLSPLPLFAGLSKAERKEKILALLNERTEILRVERRLAGNGFLGIEAVLDQLPGTLPIESSRSNRPPCYTKNAEIRRKFRMMRRARLSQYMKASIRYRLGDYRARFPPYSFKPTLNRKPRRFPFQILPDDHFKVAG